MAVHRVSDMMMCASARDIESTEMQVTAQETHTAHSLYWLQKMLIYSQLFSNGGKSKWRLLHKEIGDTILSAISS